MIAVIVGRRASSIKYEEPVFFAPYRAQPVRNRIAQKGEDGEFLLATVRPRY
jgi:hypothetical protein